MTQIFDKDGAAHPATVLRVPKTIVTAVKTTEKDGYDAVQVAAGEQKESRVAKATKTALGGAYQFVQEFRPRKNQEESTDGIEKGAEFDASVFAVGDTVSVSAISKGKGFQGVVKRHGFAGDKASHGRKHTMRAPGSIGATGPARVFKGKKMAGRMGGDRVTVKNLTILQVNADENLLLVKGAVPGRKGTLVEVRSA